MIKMKKNKINIVWIIGICGAVLISSFILPKLASGELLDNWKDENVYCPAPIVFLHGFARGSPTVTWTEDKDHHPNVDLRLEPYFRAYWSGSPPGSIKVLIPDTRYPYLEVINFIDEEHTGNPRQEFIDRNSSIDTYQAGDYYVLTGERNIGDPGWSDKVDDAVYSILNGYDTDKVILVCHSMGGLAAREYFKTFNGGDNAVRLITIATPHLGSYLATAPRHIRRTQKIGWFLPWTDWQFSFTVKAVDVGLERIGLVDNDGDAIRDMEPDSGFLQQLNSSQPQGVDYFAICGEVWWHSWYSGDGIVSLSSARGEGVLTLKDEAIVRTWHGNVPRVASEGNPSPLLRFIDSTTPVVEITSPDPNASTIVEINTPTVTVEGTVDKEYLPADTDFTIKVVRDEDGVVVFEKSYSQCVRPFANSNPKPAGFSEEDINLENGDGLLKEGRYTISVVATNPAGISSEEATSQVNVVLNKPVITDVGPEGDITNRTPTIQARIYSPDEFNIDLSSIDMKLDGLTVTHTVTPETGGPDVTISYTPINDLGAGLHTVVVNAQDINGFAADQKIWDFTIIHTAITFGANVRVDDTGTSTSEQQGPSLAVDTTGNIYTVWDDDRGGGVGHSDIYFAKSTDGGTSFGPNVRVDDTGTSDSWQSDTSVTVDATGNIYVVWYDRRNGNWDMYFAKSTNGGASFGPNVRVDNSGTSTSEQRHPSIAVDPNGNIYVVWYDKRNGNWDIYFAKSTNGGVSFGPNVRVDDTGASTSVQVYASVCTDANGRIYVVWIDNRNGNWDIYFARSTDGGVSFESNVQVDDGRAYIQSQNIPSVAADPAGNIYVVWHASLTGNWDIYFARSTDGGVSFGPNVRVDDTGASTSVQSFASIATDINGNIYVVWYDKRNGNSDIYFAKGEEK